MKKTHFCFTAAVLLSGLFFLASCGTNNPAIKCFNGTFIGQKENGIISFKGIPFAKPPVGSLRWKAPEPVEQSDDTYKAFTFGKSSLQTKAASEEASYNVLGEDCLTLNIWTKDLSTKKKPVMFYVHGGAFGWGGTYDPLYDGQYIVKEHNDVIVVTCNYRVNMMGFIDFSEVPGGENFPDSGYLGILDIIQGLKWVKQNAEAFGGDPDNVTIFGESAGAGIVSELLVVKEAENLFKRVIAQSGCVNFTYTHADFKRRGQTAMLMELTGAKNMDDLMKIPESELLEALYKEDAGGSSLANHHNLPLRGADSIIPEDPLTAIKNGAGKNIDFLIGTNTDENRYFIDEMGTPSLAELPPEERDEAAQIKQARFALFFGQSRYKKALEVCENDEQKNQVKEFMEMYSNLKISNENLSKNIDVDFDETTDPVLLKVIDAISDLWRTTELANETGFRIPSVCAAWNHSAAGGKTYMYLFGKKSSLYDWIGCPHAAELSYVFHNIGNEHFSGKVDPKLADKMCTAWVNFAKTGNPDSPEMKWTPYTQENRETLIINNDGSTKMENDPRKRERELLSFTAAHYLK